MEYVRQKKIDGEQIIEMRVSWDDLAFIEIKFDRNSWVVKEAYAWFKVTLDTGEEHISWAHAVCTYDGFADGVPLLKTYQRSEGIFDHGTQDERMCQQILAEVTKIVPGPVDVSEFDVAQFLLPGAKIGEVTSAQLSPAWIAAIVTGIFLVILGIYMRVKGRI